MEWGDDTSCFEREGGGCGLLKSRPEGGEHCQEGCLLTVNQWNRERKTRNLGIGSLKVDQDVPYQLGRVKGL